jgi:hypothetical protein
MPKMKTHSSLKGRFKITGTGKVTPRYKDQQLPFSHVREFFDPH